MKPLDVESAVRERYSEASQKRVEALCCPVDYDRQYLKVIPQEVIERDYGCGDPSRHVRAGEIVLDLGSGTGKICFIAAQVVGAAGRVIGVDMNDDMLAVARRNAPVVGNAIGFHNVEFRKGRIQDLGLDLEKFATWLQTHPAVDLPTYFAAQAHATGLRQNAPLIADASIDVVVSNCVLNLVEPSAKEQLFRELYRVLKPTGRAVISDIVSDRPVPEAMKQDAELWSGCISGAMAERDFSQAFVNAGFGTVRTVKRDAEPWQTVNGIEFRSVTLEAFKANTIGLAVEPVISCCAPGRCC